MKNTWKTSLWLTLYCAALSFAFPAIAADSPEIAQLRAAAEAGDANAQFQLGSDYQMGEGVRQDETEGVKWMTKAANQGNLSAQFNLGIAYRGGFGIEQSNVMSYKWFEIAATQGHEGATQARMALFHSMTDDQVKQAKKLASEWKPSSAR